MARVLVRMGNGGPKLWAKLDTGYVIWGSLNGGGRGTISNSSVTESEKISYGYTEITPFIEYSWSDKLILRLMGRDVRDDLIDRNEAINLCDRIHCCFGYAYKVVRLRNEMTNPCPDNENHTAPKMAQEIAEWIATATPINAPYAW